MRPPSDPTDRSLPLGAPIRPQPSAPAPRPTDNPEVLRRPDKTLETQIAHQVSPRRPA